jgi:hypothetical protein
VLKSIRSKRDCKWSEVESLPNERILVESLSNGMRVAGDRCPMHQSTDGVLFLLSYIFRVLIVCYALLTLGRQERMQLHAAHAKNEVPHALESIAVGILISCSLSPTST